MVATRKNVPTVCHVCFAELDVCFSLFAFYGEGMRLVWAG